MSKLAAGALLALGVALPSLPAATQDAFVITGPKPKALFVGQWMIAGRDVTCGTWPRNLEIAEANRNYIVADGKEYQVTGLPGDPPHDTENTVITENMDFQITGYDQKLLIISFKTGGKVTGQCGYVRLAGQR